MRRLYAGILALFVLACSAALLVKCRPLMRSHPVHFAPLVFGEAQVPPIPRFPVFLVYQQNVDMFRNAFQSAQEAFPGQIVIIDNSESTEMGRDPDFKEAAAYYHTAVLLSFPQIMNLLATLSKAWHFSHFGWMHSDGVVIKKDPSEDVSAIVDSKLQSLGSSWGVAFTFYDILAFYSTKVVLEHPWDENYLQNYMADCDVYHRWRLGGYTTEVLPGISIHLQVVHMASLPSKSWAQMNRNQRLKDFPAMDKKQVLVDPNFWKQKHTSTRATTSQAGRYNAAFQYFEAKWGSTVSDIGCKVGDLTVKPRFDVAPSAMYDLALPPKSKGFKPATSKIKPSRKLW